MSLTRRALFPALLLARVGRSQCELMSWDEYRSARRSFPYVLRVGRLVMFGARHTRDPRDAQLVELERLWREHRPEVAFSEGGIRPPSADRDEAVAQYGEAGLLRFLADRDRVTLRNLEPPEDEEASAMRRRFSAEQLKLFYYLRLLIGRDAPEAERRYVLASVRDRHRLAGSPETVVEAEALARRLLPGYAGARAEWFDPTRDDTALNGIARAVSEYRNCHMIPLVVGEARKGRRVFVVVGGSHVVVQERAIRSGLAGAQEQ